MRLDRLDRLDRLGCRGDYSFEVFNDDDQQMPLPVVDARARRPAVWLGEDVLHRSAPLPGRMRLRRARAATTGSGICGSSSLKTSKL